MVNVYEFAGNIMHRCSQSVKELLNEEPYLFIPSKSLRPKALAIAHCDTVFDEDSLRTTRKAASWKGKNDYTFRDESVRPVRQGANRIVSGNLDDRLGVAIILDILPKIMPEFAYDILLTDDEEIGRSTADDFVRDVTKYGNVCYITTGKNGKEDLIEVDMTDRLDSYQFIFEFDRAGTDVVTYDFYNVAAETMLEDAGWRIGAGSFSDICEVGPLGLWAANFGCGYHRQHTYECYVDLRELDINLRRFMYFVDLLGNKTLLDHPKPKRTNYGGRYYSSFYDDDDYVIGGTSTDSSGKVASKFVSSAWDNQKNKAIYDQERQEWIKDSMPVYWDSKQMRWVEKQVLGKPESPKMLVDQNTNRLVDEDDDLFDADLERLANGILSSEVDITDPFHTDDPSAIDSDERWRDAEDEELRLLALEDDDDDPLIIVGQDDPFAPMEIIDEEDTVTYVDPDDEGYRNGFSY